MTDKQAESLEDMRSCLVCQLCDKRMTEPATLLACAHSFCHNCILKYTENSWTCPLPGCRTPVTMKGGSRESIKKNHLISAVASSLVNIEQIIATGPANWWVGRKDEGQKSSVQFEDEEEVVDFQMIMDQDSNNRKREGSASEEEDDASSTTKEYNIGEDITRENNAAGGQSGRETMSLDQSLFPLDESAKFNEKYAAPPEFSCSPIAMQSSQPEPNDSPMPSIYEDNGRRTATVIQLDRVLMPTAQKSDTKSAIGQLEEAPSKPSSSRKKQRSSISTPSDPLSLGKKSPPEQRNPRRATRVSFQQQPRVMLLNPSWTLSSAHTRCLRKCTNDGFVSMLKMRSNDAFDNDDEYDSGFDFDTKEGRELFLASLSSNRTVQQPPAPMSFYAISTEKDESFSFDEAITVPRSFPYYLAVACGLPIVDIEFISSAANLKRRGTMNHQRYPFPSLPGAGSDKKRDKKKNSQKEYLVLGASNYSWGAPKKARAAALDRHSLWQKEEGPHAQSETLLPGTDLLHEYSVLLLGEFDQPNHSKRTVAKRKKQRDSEIKGGGYCTRGNISLLLQLCGAKVYDIDSVAASKHIKKGLTVNHFTSIKKAMPLGAPGNGPILINALQSVEEGSHSNIIVMVKDKSDSKLGSEFLNQLNSVTSMAEDKVSQIPVVSCQWLFDSIGEFEAKDTRCSS